MKEEKIFNTEVVSRLEISENIPKFSEMRKGTQVYIQEKYDKTLIYDNFSAYNGATAKKWRVKIYELGSGRLLDKICMCNGVYPKRERALAEIERFAGRSEDMIFFVIPVDFSYDRKAFIWSDEEGVAYDENSIATEEEMIVEAERRILFITGRKQKKVLDKKDLSKTELKALEAFFENEEEEIVKNKCYPYFIIDFNVVLYVSSYKCDWNAERTFMGKKGDFYDGIASAFVYNSYTPCLSEFGDVFFKSERNKLFRVA